MDVLVMPEEHPDQPPVLAHVNSVPAPLDSDQPSREVVTLYGVPTPESLALALAAAVESHRGDGGTDTIRHLGLWAERGAVGDAAWRDRDTGQLMTRDLEIPLEILHETAKQILRESGQLLRRLIAGLSMPDWPEGARRGINFSLAPVLGAPAATKARLDTILETWRETDGLTFDYEAD